MTPSFYFFLLTWSRSRTRIDPVEAISAQQHAMSDRGRQPMLVSMTARSYPAERISELIGTIYDCVLDPGRWPSVVDNIRLGAGVLLRGSRVYPLPGGEVTLGVATGIDSVRLGEVPAHGQDLVDLRGGDIRVKQISARGAVAQGHAL
ncbi:hypothetical protein EN816_32875 [Mesorhizobium sp. M8A.F.Ca.ET.173.01.1.1]|nr:hypothetical protein EN816_32875 [Mesorhizobium sp. M8A.F.Ca.ET.173.01.1.1]